jgi:hypothetical protein
MISSTQYIGSGNRFQQRATARNVPVERFGALGCSYLINNARLCSHERVACPTKDPRAEEAQKMNKKKPKPPFEAPGNRSFVGLPLVHCETELLVMFHDNS